MAYERELGGRFLDGLPASCRLYGLADDGRPRPDVRLQRRRAAARRRSRERLGERGFAVWCGNYYALEVMERLGLEPDGAVRVGIVHYNTADEVDGLLAELAAL